MHISPDFIALTIGASFIVLDRLGLLERLGLKKRSVADADSELRISDRALTRVTAERDRAIATAIRLEHERSNKPVLEILGPTLELVKSVSETQQQTLEKLASFNGTLSHLEVGLGNTVSTLKTATEGMKALMGTIAELHDIPLSPRPARRRPAK